MRLTKVELTQVWLWGILLTAMWGVSLWRFQPQAEPIFFHYNVYFGVDWIGMWYLGYLIPSSALLIVILNGLFIRHIRLKNTALAHIIVIWTSVALIFLTVNQFIVLLLNGNA